ncbi:class D sortase [Sporosarcina sp. Sa2YVA2]|uniref:Class D sortase n=1 Tax=Sporosarcina quadrami TaxID=2762234 RepID=A0ABR8U9Z9_9BACL|nr:class D sortase [Sporosarcina quadrami]MBD7984865.1 class D sortase [Sporosarcina quadrami]
MMKKVIRWSGTLLMITGVGLLVWLMNGKAKADEHEQQLLHAFQSMQAEVPNANNRQPQSERTSRKDRIQQTTEQTQANNPIEGMEGILSIPSIEMEAPVMYGTDAAILDQSLGAIENMDPPGAVGGSYAIAGHQAHVFGKYFNRLHEVEVGTEFTFQTTNGDQTYKVFDVKIVQPHEVDVLDPDPEIALMSLITCYPEYSNTHRLVVQAELVK